MKRLCWYISFLLMCLLTPSLHAEVVRLKSGTSVQGIIVFQNEEVVVVKDASGARYQYLMTDVDAILSDEIIPEEKPVETGSSGARKVAVSVQLATGVSVLPEHKPGVAFSGDVAVGAANLLDKQIFLGGAFGVHANKMGAATYTFLPVQLRAEMPFMQGKHAPLLAVGLGYGISATKGVKGGLCAGADLGWRCALSAGRAVFLGAYASFQNARLTLTEVVEGHEYTGLENRNFCSTGLKLAFYL